MEDQSLRGSEKPGSEARYEMSISHENQYQTLWHEERYSELPQDDDVSQVLKGVAVEGKSSADQHVEDYTEWLKREKHIKLYTHIGRLMNKQLNNQTTQTSSV